jgi:CRISPR-associated endonuclease Cas1
MIDRTLLINQAFALRQRNGIPVFTSIVTTESQYHESELDYIIHNLNKKKKVMGLTTSECFDVQYKEMLKRTPKKSRIKTDYPINLINLDRIIITPMGKGYISTYFLEFMKEHKIPIYFVDNRGKIDSCFLPYIYKKPSLMIKQLEARINGKGIEIAKYLVRLKLEAQGMKNMINYLDDVNDIRAIIRIEGEAANAYFVKWKFSDEWQWTGRHGRNRFMNTLAVDPINSMLNFGYGLLGQQMAETLIKRGFEPCIGFLHQNELKNKYWNMLAYDFIEPFRLWIDNCVKEMVAEKEIKPTDFTFAEDKSHLIFKENALGIALSRFMETMEPLEHKSLPIIRTVEKMLVGSNLDES